MPDNQKNTNLTKIIITVIVTVLLDVTLVYLGTLSKFQLGWSIGCVGIITFFGMLIIVSFASSSASMITMDSIRKAITASFISMYFVFVSIISLEDTQITDVAIVQPVISHFTYLVGLVVAFYFASTSLSEYMKKKLPNETGGTFVQPPVNNITPSTSSTTGTNTQTIAPIVSANTNSSFNG